MPSQIKSHRAPAVQADPIPTVLWTSSTAGNSCGQRALPRKSAETKAPRMYALCRGHAALAVSCGTRWIKGHVVPGSRALASTDVMGGRTTGAVGSPM
jgi:hypothetical protein